jgi:hypothetical protein
VWRVRCRFQCGGFGVVFSGNGFPPALGNWPVVLCTLRGAVLCPGVSPWGGGGGAYCEPWGAVLCALGSRIVSPGEPYCEPWGAKSGEVEREEMLTTFFLL